MDRNYYSDKDCDWVRVVALRKESVDRNSTKLASFRACITSLSARRAWIEIVRGANMARSQWVSLSARRAWIEIPAGVISCKTRPWSLSARRAWIEMTTTQGCASITDNVALRKESVDRNIFALLMVLNLLLSLSARRAWIEIPALLSNNQNAGVALRKESVDRNYIIKITGTAPRVAHRKDS